MHAADLTGTYGVREAAVAVDRTAPCVAEFAMVLQRFEEVDGSPCAD
jgi:hypothetical protein